MAGNVVLGGRGRLERPVVEAEEFLVHGAGGRIVFGQNLKADLLASGRSRVPDVHTDNRYGESAHFKENRGVLAEEGRRVPLASDASADRGVPVGSLEATFYQPFSQDVAVPTHGLIRVRSLCHG